MTRLDEIRAALVQAVEPLGRGESLSIEQQRRFLWGAVGLIDAQRELEALRRRADALSGEISRVMGELALDIGNLVPREDAAEQEPSE